MPLILLKKKLFGHAVLCDINQAPLESAKANFRIENLNDKAEYILTDGLSNVRCDGNYVISICGMGGELIKKILSDDLSGIGLSTRATRLVLQPMSRLNILRCFLYGNGYNIIEEMAVSEEDKLYILMSVCYDGHIRDVSDADLYLGQTVPSGDTINYYNRLITRFINVRDGKIKAGLDFSFENILIEEAERRLAKVEKNDII